MDVMGFSLNNMTLLGLTLAVGIVIDDDGEAELRLHATSVASVSGNEQ